MSSGMEVHVGVDVGGTNTDAVVMHKDAVIGWAKHVTTADVTAGVKGAIRNALNHALSQITEADKALRVLRVHIGTTHFVNAFVQRRKLAKVSLIRLCGKSSVDLPPFCDFPADLKKIICASTHMIDGGYDVDGQHEIAAVDENQVINTLKDIQAVGCKNIVVAGVFSTVNSSHEVYVRELIHKHYPEASVTLSHEVGQIGLLERENASVLNESLKPLCRETVTALEKALQQLGLTCPFFLTQNDGTLLSQDRSLSFPVFTFGSGPTNSMRGAAFLLDGKDASCVVIDIGGTSTDVGVIAQGSPRESSTTLKIAGVRTNFRMPDVLSIGLGGGSLVSESNGKVRVGPLSLGYKLEKEALVFGGSTLTATDVAVAAGLADIGNRDLVKGISLELVSAAKDKMKMMVEEAIDSVKVRNEDVPVILVGGGSVLIGEELCGASSVVRPAHYRVANAVGAALSQVSGTVDFTEDLTNTSRDEAVERGRKQAIQMAIKAGAAPGTITIVESRDRPLTYIPGNVTRIIVKAVGDLDLDSLDKDHTSVWKADVVEPDSFIPDVAHASYFTGQGLSDDFDEHLMDVKPHEPFIDAETGEWVLSPYDVECVAVGAGIMGCGGGFHPHLGRVRALRALREGKKIRVVTPERFSRTMKDHEYVVMCGDMGAPTVSHERLKADETLEGTKAIMLPFYLHHKNIPFGEGAVKEGDGVLYIEDFSPEMIPEDLRRNNPMKLVGLISFEAGGCNCLEPFVIGAELDLPIIDGDGMGRAFPELQHIVSLMYGLPCQPALLMDYAGNQVVLLKADSPKQLENIFRKKCVDMGSSCGLALRPFHREHLTGEQPLLVNHTISRTRRLGHAVISAYHDKTSPIEAILHHEGGRLLITGKVSDVVHHTRGGFVIGRLIITGFDDFQGVTLKVDFQNENLIVREIGEGAVPKVLACVPDLIAIVDSERGFPIATEEIRYGLRVALLAIPAPPILTTETALEYVGPQAFGYPPDVAQYKPFMEYIKHDPIPPL